MSYCGSIHQVGALVKSWSLVDVGIRLWHVFYAGMLSTLYVPYVVRCTLYAGWEVLYVPLVRSCTLALGHQAAAAASLMHPAGLWPLKDTYISDVFTINTML
jgi:hypothetical protein